MNKTHFGYQTVDEVEKASKVADVFHSVASKYDVMNDLMSFGLHRIWKKLTIAKAQVRPGQKILDIAGGTGDLARAGGIAVLVIMLHSGADYPLRTLTISVLLALCCALLELGRTAPGSAARRTDTPHSLAKVDPSR